MLKIMKIFVVLCLIVKFVVKSNDINTCSTVNEDCVINWSAFDQESSISIEESKDLISAIPIQQYWDVLKGAFRTGIIGEKIIELKHRDLLVSHIEKKVTVKGKIRSVGTDVVELPIVFMHAINTLKDLFQTHEYLKNHSSVFYVSGRRQNELLASMGSNWETPASLKMQKEILKEKLQQTKNKIDNQQLQLELFTSNLKYFHNRSKSVIDNNNQNVLTVLTSHQKEILSIHKIKQGKLLDMLVVEEESLLKKETELIQKELTVDSSILSQNAEVSLRAMEFRLKEEQKLWTVKGDIETKVLVAKTAASTDTLQEAMSELVQQVGQQWFKLFSEPDGLQYLWKTVVIILSFLFLYEIGMSLNILVTSLLTKRNRNTLKIIRNNVRKENKSLFLNPLEKEKLLKILSRLRLGSQHLLVLGKSGCGKTFISNYISDNFQSIRLSGGDLQALGSAAGPLLNSITKEAHLKKTLLLIDDADGLIVTRHGDSSSPPHPCLFSIMEATRHNNTTLSVIITSRLSIEKIDSAVIDRMDEIICLDLPTLSNRQDFSLQLLQKQLLHFTPNSQNGFSLNDIDVLGLGEDISTSPETDRLHQLNIDNSTDDNFNFRLCFKFLLEISEDWSFRDIEKFFANVRSAVLGSDRCILTTSIWMQELRHWRSTR